MGVNISSVDRMAQLQDIMTGHFRWQFNMVNLLEQEGPLLGGQLHETGSQQVLSSAEFMRYELQMALQKIDNLISAQPCGRASNRSRWRITCPPPWSASSI